MAEVTQLLPAISIDACDGYGRTGLLWAAFYGNSSILNWLIDNGANVQHQDRNGYCALHFAGQEKQLACAGLLLQHGADLELADRHGNTHLDSAFQCKGRLSACEPLHGCNLDHVNLHQKTPRELLDGFGWQPIK
ncbi:ankyrin repeat domain-containing protein [Hymenobacter taeanensis]|uniref:Ankyrin repeat domain-containing protein n=1 Tax=Hymenobacter taeanensis TaxID=2735321 RepID=A0A6M6BK55_9BACT|nr:ankyrin repeat domain-containing protein [Hymenobacter taeanensis]